MWNGKKGGIVWPDSTRSCVVPNKRTHPISKELWMFKDE